MNWRQVEQRLAGGDREVVPLGSTEQHGWPSLGTDAILAERVAVEAATPLGIPVLPGLPIGMAPYFAAFPGSLSLRPATYLAVLTDLLDTLWESDAATLPDAFRAELRMLALTPDGRHGGAAGQAGSVYAVMEADDVEPRLLPRTLLEVPA